MKQINIKLRKINDYSIICISTDNPLEFGDIQNYFTRLLTSIIPDEREIFIDSVVNWDWLKNKRPKGFNIFKWFFSSKKQQVKYLLDLELTCNNVFLLDDIDNRWHTLLGLGQSKEKIKKYFQGYGESVLSADIIYVGSDRLHFTEHISEFRSKKFIKDLEDLDSGSIKKVMDIFEMTIIACAGLIYIIVPDKVQDTVVEKIKSFN